ncbi:hypothetical protein M9434_000306 [Picochlorum sp. BPE23]|nr:hypothetical protein M9434_000306 [Picochlorum sp. BPE23]
METVTTVHNEVYFSIYRLESSRRGKEDELECADVQRCVDGILSDIGYIWQRDTFQFINVRKDCLYGKVRFDENMDDEWFVVWLLKRISEQVPGLAVHVWDNDGEFLLIEAAYSLPRWLEPEVAENRVWIMGGKVHCIPKLVRPSGWQGIEGSVTLEQAMDALQNHSEETEECGRGIDEVVQRKIDVYPGYAMETMHRSPAVLPRSIASLIISDPQCISRSVRAFHTSGPKERRAASKFDNYPLDNGVIPIVVCMNRCQYSQLMLTEYQPPDDSPWNRIVQSKDDDVYRHACDLGFKIALGFDLMGPMVIPDLSCVDEYKLAPYSENAWNEYIDDDSWLYTASDRLQEELDAREKEQELHGFDPDELSKRMKQFVDTMSTMHGADIVDEEIQFDPDAFLNMFREVDDDASSVSEGSSFYALGSSSDDDRDTYYSRNITVNTDTDSDDDEAHANAGNMAEGDANNQSGADDEFTEAYSEVLADQLRGTSLDASFAGTSGDDGTMNPVDVDVNLVSHLLASYEEQGALPGPASTLAGMLGISLPRRIHKDKSENDARRNG